MRITKLTLFSASCAAFCFGTTVLFVFGWAYATRVQGEAPTRSPPSVVAHTVCHGDTGHGTCNLYHNLTRGRIESARFDAFVSVFYSTIDGDLWPFDRPIDGSLGGCGCEREGYRPMWMAPSDICYWIDSVEEKYLLLNDTRANATYNDVCVTNTEEVRYASYNHIRVCANDVVRNFLFVASQMYCDLTISGDAVIPHLAYDGNLYCGIEQTQARSVDGSPECPCRVFYDAEAFRSWGQDDHFTLFMAAIADSKYNWPLKPVSTTTTGECGCANVSMRPLWLAPSDLCFHVRRTGDMAGLVPPFLNDTYTAICLNMKEEERNREELHFKVCADGNFIRELFYETVYCGVADNAPFLAADGLLFCAGDYRNFRPQHTSSLIPPPPPSPYSAPPVPTGPLPPTHVFHMYNSPGGGIMEIPRMMAVMGLLEGYIKFDTLVGGSGTMWATHLLEYYGRWLTREDYIQALHRIQKNLVWGAPNNATCTGSIQLPVFCTCESHWLSRYRFDWIRFIYTAFFGSYHPFLIPRNATNQPFDTIISQCISMHGYQSDGNKVGTCVEVGPNPKIEYVPLHVSVNRTPESITTPWTSRMCGGLDGSDDGNAPLHVPNEISYIMSMASTSAAMGALEGLNEILTNSVNALFGEDLETSPRCNTKNYFNTPNRTLCSDTDADPPTTDGKTHSPFLSGPPSTSAISFQDGMMCDQNGIAAYISNHNEEIARTRGRYHIINIANRCTAPRPSEWLNGHSFALYKGYPIAETIEVFRSSADMPEIAFGAASWAQYVGTLKCSLDRTGKCDGTHVGGKEFYMLDICLQEYEKPSEESCANALMFPPDWSAYATADGIEREFGPRWDHFANRTIQNIISHLAPLPTPDPRPPPPPAPPSRTTCTDPFMYSLACDQSTCNRDADCHPDAFCSFGYLRNICRPRNQVVNRTVNEFCETHGHCSTGWCDTTSARWRCRTKFPLCTHPSMSTCRSRHDYSQGGCRRDSDCVGTSPPLRCSFGIFTNICRLNRDVVGRQNGDFCTQHAQCSENYCQFNTCRDRPWYLG